MRRHFISLAAAAIAVMLQCCGNKAAEEPAKSVGLSTAIEGDSTLYGLACDGCSDSVLVFLPGQGGDPVTYSIIQARKRQRVIGRPRVGDWVCLIVNAEDKHKADLVIDLDELKGNWVSLEKPERRQLPHVGPRPKMEPEERAMMDSMMKAELQPIEIGFALKRHYTAAPIGMRAATSGDDEDRVVYPTPKRYTGWHIYNGRLVLIEQQRGGGDAQQPDTVSRNDTVDIVLMMKDSLRLRFADGTVRGYYRK